MNAELSQSTGSCCSCCSTSAAVYRLNCEVVKADETSSEMRQWLVFVSLQCGVIRCQLEEEEEWRHKDHLPVRDERFLCHGLHHRPCQLSDWAVVPWSVLCSVYVDTVTQFKICLCQSFSLVTFVFDQIFSDLNHNFVNVIQYFIWLFKCLQSCLSLDNIDHWFDKFDSFIKWRKTFAKKRSYSAKFKKVLFWYPFQKSSVILAPILKRFKDTQPYCI